MPPQAKVLFTPNRPSSSLVSWSESHLGVDVDLSESREHESREGVAFVVVRDGDRGAQRRRHRGRRIDAFEASRRLLHDRVYDPNPDSLLVDRSQLRALDLYGEARIGAEIHALLQRSYRADSARTGSATPRDTRHKKEEREHTDGIPAVSTRQSSSPSLRQETEQREETTGQHATLVERVPRPRAERSASLD